MWLKLLGGYISVGAVIGVVAYFNQKNWYDGYIAAGGIIHRSVFDKKIASLSILIGVTWPLFLFTAKNRLIKPFDALDQKFQNRFVFLMNHYSN